MYLSDAASYIPESYLTVEEAGELLGISRENSLIYKKIYGIEKIPVERKLGLVEFMKQPLQALLQKNALDGSEINYLIHCHTSKLISPFGNSLIRTVKNELGLKRATAFGSSINNCATVVNVLDVVAQILSKDETEYALIVCADYTFTSTLKLIPNISILADGAAAILVSNQGTRNKLVALETQIAGRYSRGMWLDAAACKHFEDNYIDLLKNTILNALSKANLQLEQLKIIFPHNVNYPSWRKLAAALDVPLKKIYLDNIKKYSHCFGADIFINYVSALTENKLQPGDYYLMATVGLGATFAAMVFQY
jgi:3-oxoacyl-[acyl-carrier-protein] synthase III